MRRVFGDIIGSWLLWMPGRIGSEMRVAYYRARGARIGQRVRLDPGVSMDRPELISIGDESWIDRFAILIAGPPRPGRETRLAGDPSGDLLGHLVIGAGCHVGAHVILSGIGGIAIADHVTIAAGSKVYSLTHHFRSWARPSDRSVIFGSQAPVERQAMLQGPVILGPNVGIGVDCLVLPGTRINQDSFVRPGSIVRGSWQPNSLIGGNPATLEGVRFPDAAG